MVEPGALTPPTPYRNYIYMVAFQTPEDPVDENENIRQLIAHFHQSEQARIEDAKKQLRTQIIPQLVQHRVANVEVAYSGCGDSGAIDGLQYRDAAGQREASQEQGDGDAVEHIGRTR